MVHFRAYSPTFFDLVVPRCHLFEFEDQGWFPGLIRGYMTDYLQYVADKFDFYRPVTPLLLGLLDRTNQSKIVDLASGSGGGWAKLLPRLKEKKPHITVTCTDLFPKESSRDCEESENSLPFFSNDPVDARYVPGELSGMRTMFLSFHHFRPNEAASILSGAVKDNQPIFIVEAQKRDLSHIIRFALSPIFVLLLTPFIRPLRFRRILFTYLIPIIPVFVLWDGIVSVLRTYTLQELNEFSKEIDPEGSFSWEADEITGKGVTLLVFSGVPSSI
jgi:hypothetical protein